MNDRTTGSLPRWMQVFLWLLGGPNLLIGLWALLAPEHWFDNFPGWAPQLVAAYPPYNQHLATDAGAGLLALGVVALAAAFVNRRDAALVAGAAATAFTAPHALFHLVNPADALTTGEQAAGTGSLVITAAAAVAVLVGATRMEGSRA